MRTAFDTIVTGSGAFGAAVAFELAKRSLSVLLIDKTWPGRATSASAGGRWPLGEAVGLGCGVILHAARGGPHAPPHGAAVGPQPLPAAYREFLLASNSRFPGLARELRELSGVDIEYQPGRGLLFVAFNLAERAFIEQVARSFAGSGLLEIVTAAEARRLEPQLSPHVFAAAYLPGEHQVNPLALCEAYKRAACKLGAVLVHETEVTRICTSSGRVTGVEAGGQWHPAGSVVNAAGAWAGRLAATAGLKLPVFPVRGQVVLTEQLPATLQCCLSTTACYLVQKVHGEVLIGSTTEHAGFDVAVTADAIRGLSQGAVRTVPHLASAHIKRTWAGLRPGTPDELPILGPVQGLSGYFNAAGGFRTGIVASPLAGAVVAQCVAAEPTDVPLEPFLLARFSPASLAATPSETARPGSPSA